MQKIVFFFAVFVLLFACRSSLDDSAFQHDYSTWTSYLGGPDRNHYSTLGQITLENVKDLEIAWTYDAPDSGQMQMNPIIVEDILYGISSGLQVFALNAASGEEIWRFGDPLNEWHSTSRGVSYWSDGEDQRILFTRGAELFALNAKTGQPVSSFGNDGKIDLHDGLPEIAKDKFIISNTPGTIFENLIIMPFRLSEGADAAPGDIRAFDVRTGKLVWTFHTIPYPDEFGYDTWKNKEAYKNIDVGAANNWAGMALDPRLGILFVPTGSASPDFYGGKRHGDNLFANCLLALNVRTGQRIWHFQSVHHDLWDRDFPAPPNLLKVERNGKKIEAVAQVTKQGYIFLFERTTGKPLFEIKEIPVPPSKLPNEEAALTQPVPVLPKPFARQSDVLTLEDISPYATNKEELIQRFNQFNKNLFQPPGLEPVLLFPGYDGGAEWGGAAADPEEGIIYVNANEMAWELGLEAVPDNLVLSSGEALYQTNCASCHKKDRQGAAQSGFPALTDIKNKMSRSAIKNLITNGKGMMTGFPQLSESEKTAIIDFLLNIEKEEVLEDQKMLANLPFQHTGYHKFLDSEGLPAIAPPWGTLHAVNLNTGEYLWSIPFGETPSLKEKGYPTTGTENYGGPISTANGLLFIAATKDGYFRAFDKKNGKLLWETQLPAAAFATPSTYSVNGKQYIVIACGGEKLGTPKGNKIVAFALK